MHEVDNSKFRVPSDPLRSSDIIFWGNARPTLSELNIEEYAVIEDQLASPKDNFFDRKIPKEVRAKMAERMYISGNQIIDSANRILTPFDYELKEKDGARRDYGHDLYELYRGGELILDQIDSVRPISVSASEQDFALILGVLNSGYRLLRREGLQDWDTRESFYGAPIFSGEDLLIDRWEPQRTQIQICKDNEPIFAYSTMFLVASPIKFLSSWEGHWFAEINGALIQDGKILNNSLGYEEIFGFQILSGKPYYYFRKGPRVGISYAGQILPTYYDDIFHYACCGPARYNNGGNETMAWFMGLRDGVWYYVEITSGN